MKTVLLNLMDNGRKAMEDGGRMYLLGRTDSRDFPFMCRIPGKECRKKSFPGLQRLFIW